MGDRLKTDPHVVEGDAHALGEIRAEERDLGVALAEVVQHDEVSVHLHADANGLRGRAGWGGAQDQRESISWQFGSQPLGGVRASGTCTHPASCFLTGVLFIVTIIFMMVYFLHHDVYPNQTK